MKSRICFALVLALTCGFAFGKTSFEVRDNAKSQLEKIDARLAMLAKNGARAFLSPVEIVNYLYKSEFRGQVYRENDYKLTTEEKLLAIYRKSLEQEKKMLESRIKIAEMEIASRDHRKLNAKNKAPVVPYRVNKRAVAGKKTAKGAPPELPSLRKAVDRMKLIQSRRERAKNAKKAADAEK